MKSFLGSFYRHLAIFSGHIGSGGKMYLWNRRKPTFKLSALNVSHMLKCHTTTYSNCQNIFISIIHKATCVKLSLVYVLVLSLANMSNVISRHVPTPFLLVAILKKVFRCTEENFFVQFISVTLNCDFA